MGLDEDLHSTTSKSENQVEGRFLLNVVIRKSSAIFELLSSKNESLLLRRDAFLVLNLGLDVGNRVIGLNVQGDGLSGQGFDEDLHGTTTKSEYQVEGRFLLDVVIGECTSVFQLFSSEDESLLLRRDAFLV